MKRLLIPALLFSGWMAFLNSDIPVKGNFIPALGRFLSPFLGVWQNVTADVSSYELRGLTQGAVKILFDERDVPHIYADNLADALFAQGYVHAANRIFSMDISTRSAAGRLSELVGSRAIAIDRKQRERGFERSAFQKAQSWETYGDNKALIDAYVRGVNAFVESIDYKNWPIEYKILSHEPVMWSNTHCALMQTNLAISLCLGEDDVEYSTARAKLSPEEFSFLYPDHNSLESPIIPSEKKWDFIPLKSKNEISAPPQPGPDKHSEDSRNDNLNGSNNWAVAASKTANGFPILANDPHLSLTLPNIWYEMEIHTPEMSVHGVTLPGLPFIVIGFNESIAWGSTNSGQDVLDWYQVHWKDTMRNEYWLDGKTISATLKVEEIKVRGGKTVIDTIRYTYWGPVSHLDEHKDMAMKWIGHQKATINDVAYLQKINKAKTLDDYRDAVSVFQYPAQNKIFANIQGDIAISVAGVMPIRPEGLGETVTNGEETKNDWLGFIPFEQAPYVINPTRGFVSSANQAPADPSYPYPFLGKRYFEDYRGRVVNMVLDSIDKMTPEDMQQLQQNNYDLHAAELLPLLMAALKESECVNAEDERLLHELSNWDYLYDRDSMSPVLFTIWYELFEEMVWDELDTLHVMRPEEWRLSEIVRDLPGHKYFDRIATENKTESFTDIACESFAMMVKSYRELEEDEKKNWGHYKRTYIPHLARFPQFGIDFISTSGGKHIVNAMSKNQGPSWRMIVELSNPPKAWVNYPGGQSGNPASPHYIDMLEPFFEGKYYEVAIRKEPSWNPVRQININPL